MKENAYSKMTTILVGNKTDLEHRRTVSFEEGQLYARSHNIIFLETSAKTSNNVEEAFNKAAERILRCVDDRLTAHVETRIDEYGAAGLLFER